MTWSRACGSQARSGSTCPISSCPPSRSLHTADAADFPLEAAAWDAALCLGASFVWGNIGDAAARLVPAVTPGGFVAVGEPYWREWPLPDVIDDEGYVGL